MADLRKLFGTDKKKENEGVWQEVAEGLEVLVARVNNPKHQDALERLSKPYRGQLQRGTLSHEKQQVISIEAMAEGVLLGWRSKGLDGQVMMVAGQPLEYSKENAVKVLMEFAEFRETVSQLAVDIELFREG